MLAVLARQWDSMLMDDGGMLAFRGFPSLMLVLGFGVVWRVCALSCSVKFSV